MKLLAITFVRKSELLYAKWEDFDLDKALWKVPAERMKMRVEHAVPLSLNAIEILKEIRKKFPSDHYLFHDGDQFTPIRDNALIEGNQVRRAYNRAQYLEERTEMMEWWSKFLEDISQ